ncbi:MAG TPA: FkbM family methyltransferase [Stellaceae bacterium]|nr:FkbM family methyltransferase [Stellaceae bacterium]
MTEIKIGTYTAALAILAAKDVRYGTVFDVGSAEGNFFLQHYVMGVFADSTPVNIDASAIYEQPLSAIKDALGGHYFIAAASDMPGEVVITTSLDPAWASVRPPSDPYWERLNNVTRGQIRVPAVTLDGLAAEHGLKGPFLIKLDVQGAETAVLRGARKVLEETHVVIPEADVDDFHAIHRMLDEAGFLLFDVTTINRMPDRSLAWFYPVYLNRKLAHLRQRAFWPGVETEAMIKRQVERRREILDWHAKILPAIRSQRGKSSA